MGRCKFVTIFRSYGNLANLDPMACLNITKQCLDAALNVHNSQEKLILGAALGP